MDPASTSSITTNSPCESCGWIAATIAMVAFGSYVVPMKSNTMQELDPDPLVYQTYMSVVVFISSWFVLLLPGQEFNFTPLGIVSAACWIPGGLAIIFAVQNAGVVLAIGIGNSTIILVAYIWGVFIFDELIKSQVQSGCAILFAIVGIFGMAYFSSTREEKPNNYAMVEYDDDNYDFPTDFVYPYDDDEDSSAASSDVRPMLVGKGMSSLEIEYQSKNTDICRCFCGIKLSKRLLGIIAAIFQGVWGGSILVPMHYASQNEHGIGFCVSFGIGSLIVTVTLWVLRFLLNIFVFGSLQDTYENLPSVHASTMLLPATISSIFWTAGNIFSMISVQSLGQGVGYAVIQLVAMIISGLWGILFYREIRGGKQIFGWLVSAVVAVGGMLFLSYEHYAAATANAKLP